MRNAPFLLSLAASMCLGFDTDLLRYTLEADGITKINKRRGTNRRSMRGRSGTVMGLRNTQKSNRGKRRASCLRSL